ncbi:uncharacterized protein LOC115369863 [Myripristis murdjan]|uniref:Uncharacterized LOC115369863 n=1 Tax=Myripristis murdjan TaxID=586833 RepID=A0A668ADM8_9TELE|nr:uncharacterized protein LOC115369863 [Myripristis murdjan]
MKVADPGEVSSIGSGVTPGAQTQKVVITPQVRYHPSIQTPAGGDAGRAKSTRRPQRTGPPATRPPQTATKPPDKTGQEAHGDRSAQGNPAPAGGRRQRRDAPAQRRPGPGQSPAEALRSPEPAELTAAGTSQLGEEDGLSGGGAAARPEDAPPCLGGTLKQEVVEEVELQTRGQRENPAWFAWRHNRITASNAHRIANCRFVSGTSQTPPTSYLAAITGDGPRVQTRAMTWGIQQEAQAVRRYQVLKSKALGRAVTVRECGLFIDARRPWLAGSPDGIVTDRRTGQSLLCLEVKCPYKHRHGTVEEACRADRAFCLEIEEERRPGTPLYRLKPSHSYFTQIQCQLAVSGLRHADLVVFTLRETAIVPVTFDPDFWAETVARLEVFYRDAVLPHLGERRPRGPAGEPEL